MADRPARFLNRLTPRRHNGIRIPARPDPDRRRLAFVLAWISRMSACRCGQYELAEHVAAMRIGDNPTIHRESHCAPGVWDSHGIAHSTAVCRYTDRYIATRWAYREAPKARGQR